MSKVDPLTIDEMRSLASAQTGYVDQSRADAIHERINSLERQKQRAEREIKEAKHELFLLKKFNVTFALDVLISHMRDCGGYDNKIYLSKDADDAMRPSFTILNKMGVLMDSRVWVNPRNNTELVVWEFDPDLVCAMSGFKYEAPPPQTPRTGRRKSR